MNGDRNPTTDDTDLAIHRFHRWAIGFSGPRRHWFLSALRFGFIMVAVSITITIPVFAARISFNYLPPPEPERGLAEMAFSTVLFAPLAETALLVLIYKVTRPYLGVGGFILVNTALFGFLHIPAKGIPAAATVAFLLMSYQYASFRHVLEPGRAFAGVAVSHGVNNGIAFLFIAVATWLDL